MNAIFCSIVSMPVVQRTLKHEPRSAFQKYEENTMLGFGFNLLHLFYCFYFICLLVYEEGRERNSGVVLEYNYKFFSFLFSHK